MPVDYEQQRKQAYKRKQLAIREAQRTQAFMQVYWTRFLRHSGFTFNFAFHAATMLSRLWYAWQRAKIELGVTS
jgi:hypothetical protein